MQAEGLAHKATENKINYAIVQLKTVKVENTETAVRQTAPVPMLANFKKWASVTLKSSTDELKGRLKGVLDTEANKYFNLTNNKGWRKQTMTGNKASVGLKI